jgi:type II restriction enzyme
MILSDFKTSLITRFLEEIDRQGLVWFVKRLSGNDTGLTGGHQSGLYIPRDFALLLSPEVCRQDLYNPDIFIKSCYMPNIDFVTENVRVVYYNSKYFPERNLKKQYDEFRMTRLGGSSSPFHNIENTGSICIFAVHKTVEGLSAVAWVATTVEEEDTIESWLGHEVDPACMVLSSRPTLHTKPPSPSFEIPVSWLETFPKGEEIFAKVLQLLPRTGWRTTIDELLLKRRELEYKIFETIEKAAVLPVIKKGFESVEEFIKYSHSVSNRRKSRTGTSLELNLEVLFKDEQLKFETQVRTENRKTADFLFPSGKAYKDPIFPADKLRMMAAKTCCKDRWRQVITEADRIETKHLFTLQEGISGNQLQEMKDNNVQLVIPKSYKTMFPAAWRDSLLTLQDFVTLIKGEQTSLL